MQSRRAGSSLTVKLAAMLVTAIALVTVAAALLLSAGASAASAKTVWLCLPGHHPDPCNPGLSTTVYSPTLHQLRVTHPQRARGATVNCFYVYPTVSNQMTTLSNLQIDPEERSIALDQAARYSQDCRVFAPMYHQVTVPALEAGNTESPAQLQVPLQDVERAFGVFLAKYDNGHPFVLIGHSQGSFVLEQLIAKLVDPQPAVRHRLLSAILMGGNVLVKDGRNAGGTFQHIPACRAQTQTGCVIAFSTFDQPPPADSLFGRTTVAGEHVLCTNPAALGGGSAVVDPVLASAPFAPGTLIAEGIKALGLTEPQPPTVWVAEPGAYRAVCSSGGGADVLQVTALHGAEVPTPSPDPTWGLHLLDANVALGNLVADVRAEAHAYADQAHADTDGRVAKAVH